MQSAELHCLYCLAATLLQRSHVAYPKDHALNVVKTLDAVRSKRLHVQRARFHGVMVSTLDSESSDPSSNLGGTFPVVVALWREAPLALASATQHR